MDTLELKSIDQAFQQTEEVVVSQYVEFIVNGKPLSQLINQHFKLDKPLFSKFTSTLGTMELTNFDRLKIHQLLTHPVKEKDVEKLFPKKHFEQEPILEELELDKILLYCCAERADSRCSGCFVKVTKSPKTFIWTLDAPLFSDKDKEDNSNELKFEFEQEAYHKAFKTYLLTLQVE